MYVIYIYIYTYERFEDAERCHQARARPIIGLTNKLLFMCLSVAVVTLFSVQLLFVQCLMV